MAAPHGPDMLDRFERSVREGNAASTPAARATAFATRANVLDFILTNKTYEDRGFASFDAYITARHALYGLTTADAYRLTKITPVLKVLGHHKCPPVNDRQVRAWGEIGWVAAQPLTSVSLLHTAHMPRDATCPLQRWFDVATRPAGSVALLGGSHVAASTPVSSRGASPSPHTTRVPAPFTTPAAPAPPTADKAAAR